ncbi:heme o synthase [Natronoarchaeum mannanilyticum]|uniref:Protoheme IX farnesyltransferase n=1 Tax=Natronoarchaeum mannanilyticum TaxID=926360 RepID=A0AAV3TCH3_9EURY
MGSHERFTWALAAAVIGVYLLIVVGATATLTEAAAACGSWPGCGGRLSAPPSGDLAIAMGHRLVALVVGATVLTVAVVGWLGGVARRVRGALAIAVVLYAVQVGIGAATATAGAVGTLSTLHLLFGTGIFGALVLSLAWTLEADTATPEDRDPVGRVEDDAEPAETPSPGETDAADETDAVDEVPTPEIPESALGRAKLTAFAYFRLMKPRLMWLLCLVASAGMALAAGDDLAIRTILLTLGGGVLAIGASGTYNHVLERDIDRKMARTSDRPVATHLVPVRNALAFAGLLTVASLALFVQVNLLAAALGLVAILFYSVIYTLVLKPNTVQNTVIGGAAGALPAMIGWAAVTGKVGLPGLALAGVIFLWTPAHFYNLALAYKEDYARGGFPMMPVVRGEAVTRKHILLYLAATLLGASALSAVADLGVLYAATAVAFGAAFLWAVVRLHRERTEGAAFRAFHASNAYLGALLIAIVVDAMAF